MSYNTRYHDAASTVPAACGCTGARSTGNAQQRGRQQPCHACDEPSAINVHPAGTTPLPCVSAMLAAPVAALFNGLGACMLMQPPVSRERFNTMAVARAAARPANLSQAGLHIYQQHCHQPLH